MYYGTTNYRQVEYPAFIADAALAYMEKPAERKSGIACNWQMLRAQLLLQWKRIAARDLDQAGPDRQRIALLIERKYGVASELVENYLLNFERTMPCR